MILPNASIAPAIPDIADAFGISDQTSVFILMTAHAPGLFMASVIGVAADRYGRRRIIVPCLLLFGLAGLVIMFSTNLAMLLTFRFIQGLGSSGFLSLALVIIGDNYDGVERTRIIGQNALAMNLSVALLPAAGGLLTELFGWRGPFAMHAATIVLAAFAATLLPPDERRTPEPLRHQLRQARPHLLQPEVGMLLLVAPFTFLIFFATGITTMPIHLENEFGASAGVRGADPSRCPPCRPDWWPSAWAASPPATPPRRSCGPAMSDSSSASPEVALSPSLAVIIAPCPGAGRRRPTGGRPPAKPSRLPGPRRAPSRHGGRLGKPPSASAKSAAPPPSPACSPSATPASSSGPPPPSPPPSSSSSPSSTTTSTTTPDSGQKRRNPGRLPKQGRFRGLDHELYREMRSALPHFAGSSTSR